MFKLEEDIGQQSDEENPLDFIATDRGFAEGLLNIAHAVVFLLWSRSTRTCKMDLLISNISLEQATNKSDILSL